MTDLARVPLKSTSSSASAKSEFNDGGDDANAFQFSNQTVLMVTCISFLLFVVGEIIGAVVGNSWSLLGDAAAMSIDVVTYGTNMIAERIN